MKREPFGKMIVHLGKDIKRIIDKDLEKFNLGSVQFKIVIKVCEREGICQEELSKILALDKTTIAKAIKKLVELDYVKKIRDKTDKRFYKVYATKKGQKIYPEIKNVLKKYENIIENILNQDEKDALYSAIEKIRGELKDFC